MESNSRSHKGGNFYVDTFKSKQGSDKQKNVIVAVIQTAIKSKISNFMAERGKFFQKIESMIEGAVKNGANILALPELFAMPYPFYCPDEINWQEYAESENGYTSELMQKLSLKNNVVIIYSILELSHDNKYFISCLVMSNRGQLIGKYRKYHIPPIEQPYLTPGDFDNSVIETEFGKIGILICYERHFPLKWLLLALNGAEIIFNPSSEDEGTLSHKMWRVESLNAGVSNGVFTVAINRCGTEQFNGKSIKYFGSSYVSCPLGYTFPTQNNHSATINSQESILLVEIDLSIIKYAKKNFSFHENHKLESYADKLYEIHQNKRKEDERDQE